MKNTVNGFDLTFVNICNEAVVRQRIDNQEWKEAREAGIKAVKEGRLKRAKRIKKLKQEKKLCRKEKILATLTWTGIMILGCIEF